MLLHIIHKNLETDNTYIADFPGCVSRCAAATNINCLGVNYAYATLAEPALTNTAASILGACSFYTVSADTQGSGTVSRNFARRVVASPTGSPVAVTSAAVTSAAVATTCPGAADGTLINNSGGEPYRIYCAADFGSDLQIVNNIASFDACLLA